MNRSQTAHNDAFPLIIYGLSGAYIAYKAYISLGLRLGGSETHKSLIFPIERSMNGIITQNRCVYMSYNKRVCCTFTFPYLLCWTCKLGYLFKRTGAW